MTGQEIQFFHSDENECDYRGALPMANFVLMPDCTLVILCKCPKCGSYVQFINRLADLYKFCRQLRRQEQGRNDRRPVKPPLAPPPAEPPKFTDTDKLEAHGLGIILPEDEPPEAA